MKAGRWLKYSRQIVLVTSEIIVIISIKRIMRKALLTLTGSRGCMK
jgi:hypothetical protein